MIYFNILECAKNILNRFDVTYEGACTGTSREKNTKMLETVADYNDRNGALLSNENLQQAINKVIKE